MDDTLFFVGDIQGCLGPLEELLRVAGFNPDHHQLMPVGDTINRGPDNVGVLQLLQSLGASPVLGNHEAKLLSVLENGDPTGFLKRETVGLDLVPHPRFQTFVDWIHTWPVYRRGDGWIQVHAGLHPSLPLGETPRRFLYTVRVCDKEGGVPSQWDGHNDTIPEGFFPWTRFYEGPDVVIYGHWARRGLVITPLTRGLDTGCVYGLKLTGMWWPSGRLVQVAGQPPRAKES